MFAANTNDISAGNDDKDASLLGIYDNATHAVIKKARHHIWTSQEFMEDASLTGICNDTGIYNDTANSYKKACHYIPASEEFMTVVWRTSSAEMWP